MRRLRRHQWKRPRLSIRECQFWRVMIWCCRVCLTVTLYPRWHGVNTSHHYPLIEPTIYIVSTGNSWFGFSKPNLCMLLCIFWRKSLQPLSFPEIAQRVWFRWYIHCSQSFVSTPADSQKIVLTLLTKFWLYVELALTLPYFLITYFHRWPGFGNAITCRFDWMCQKRCLYFFGTPVMLCRCN